MAVIPEQLKNIYIFVKPLEQNQYQISVFLLQIINFNT